MDIKESAKSYAKNYVKGHIKKWLMALLIPWGAIILVIIFAVVGLMSYFISDSGVGTLSTQQTQMIQSYLQNNNNPTYKNDYFGLAEGCEPTNQIFENYFKFLVLNNKVQLPMSNTAIQSLLSEAMKDLTPKFTYENGYVTTTLEKIGSNGQEIGTPTTSKQEVTLLKTSQSVYGDISYSYGTTTTTTTTTETVPATNNENDMKNATNSSASSTSQNVTEKETITSPTLKEQKVTNKFGMLESLLKSMGVSQDEMNTAIGAILFTKNTSNNGLNSSWEWLESDKLPNPPSPQQTGSYGGGGGIGGDLKGIPSDLQQDYQEAQKLSGVPNWLLAGDTEAESSFNPNAVSSAGAYGLMQFEWRPDGQNWYYYLNLGMNQYLAKGGFTGSPTQLWQEYLKNPKLQILVGAYEMRYYMNYVLKQEGKTSSYDFNSTSNMKLIDWNGLPNNPSARKTVALALACYNGGQGNYSNYSINYPYSVKVIDYAMKFKNSMVMGGGTQGGSKQAQAAINVGKQIIADGNSRYVFGGGRTPSQQAQNIFDCSAFVWYCYYKGDGIQVGGTMNNGYVKVDTWTILAATQRVSVNNMQPGDFVFFSIPDYSSGDSNNDHIGIYIGNDQFINCEVHGGVRIASLSNPYWSKYFDGVVTRIQ